MAYHDISNPGFNQQLRMFETTDPVHADTFNAVAKQLINNDVALSNALSRVVSDKTEQAKFLLNLHRNGKKYGVHWDAFSANSSSVGTRTEDAVGMVAKPSTNTVRAQNDFEDEGPFFHLEVNGSVNTDGTFTVTAIDGIDSDFNRYNKDTWCLYLPYYWKITIGGTGEDIVISDTKYNGFLPCGTSILPDGSLRPFVAMAKYQDGHGEATACSMSGKNPSNNSETGGSISYSGLITRMHAKGTQYCAATAQDKDHMDTLFKVAFATRNSQSVMAGATSYYFTGMATVTETGVESIVVAKSVADRVKVGSTVSIGTKASSGSEDRNLGNNNDVANRVLVTKVEPVDGSNSRVYVDNGGTTFDITADKNWLLTMPWRTGTCDDVLGSCGSPSNNTNGTEPFILFGVEMMLGQFEVLGNIFLHMADGTAHMEICYDCTKLANSVTDDYKQVAYENLNGDGQWISELGFDAANPSVRFPVKGGASASIGYADLQWNNDYTKTTGDREVLVRGNLIYGAPAGLFFANLDSGLGSAHWDIGARLSASGRSAQSAA